MVHHKIYRSLVCVSFLLFVSALADAQATRTWVSGVGDDVNPCSRTAPCKTFAGAISKTATNGEINCLDPGGFGAVTITKSITIDCEDTQGSILSAGTNGVIINITGTTDTKKAVKLRGISIDGAGTGINGVRIMAANIINIEQVVIDGVTQHGVSVEGQAQVVIMSSSIRSNGGSGVNVFLTSGTADVLVSGSSLTGNATGLNSSNGGTIRVGGSTIAYNTTGLAGAGKIFSYGNNILDANGTNGTPTSTTPLK